MIRTFCDRCGKEITGEKPIYGCDGNRRFETSAIFVLEKNDDDTVDYEDVDVCNDCRNDLSDLLSKFMTSYEH